MEAHLSELRVLCSFQVITTIKEYKLPLLSARGRCFTCGFLLEPYHSLGRQMLTHFLGRRLRPTEGLLPCLLSLQPLYLLESREARGRWEGLRRPQPASFMRCGLACLWERRAGAGRAFTVNCHWTMAMRDRLP